MFWESNELLRLNKHSYKWKRIIDCIIILLFILALIVFASSARATSSRSQIIDNANLLDEYQIDNIKVELNTLRKIPLIIIINKTGNRCTDDYAYSVAKSLCQETFLPDTEGMIIAYCSSLEGFKIGICYQGNFDIDTKQLKDKIASEYSLYSTDSSWIEGSCIQCINRIIEILNNDEEQTVEVLPQEQTSSKNPSFWEIFGKYQLMASIIFAVFVAGIIFAIIVYRKHRKQIDKNIDYWFQNKEV